MTIDNNSSYKFNLNFLNVTYPIEANSATTIDGIVGSHYILQLDDCFKYNKLTSKYYFSKLNKEFMVRNGLNEKIEIDKETYLELHRKMTLKFKDLKVTGTVDNIQIEITFNYSS
jgi:hypothetical protein